MYLALNQATQPHLSYVAFLDLAAALGCVGVEVRNDLGRPLFDGLDPAEAGAMARDRDLEILSINQISPFDDGRPQTLTDAAQLIEIAGRAGAKHISLIPSLRGVPGSPEARQSRLQEALLPLLPLLRQGGVVGLIEPLGFPKATVQHAAEAVAVIEALEAHDHVKLVHDTFQHSLGGGGQLFFPQHTGLVQISGVSDPYAQFNVELDNHRGLVDGEDRVGNLQQIRAFFDGGYLGAFSLECTDKAVHTLADPERRIRACASFLRDHI